MPLNLKLAAVLILLAFVLSVAYSLLLKFPSMGEDERISLVVTYLIAFCFGYYLFAFLLQGNVLARKALILTCALAMLVATVGVVVDFSLNLHLVISILVVVLGAAIIFFLSSSSVSKWLNTINGK